MHAVARQPTRFLEGKAAKHLLQVGGKPLHPEVFRGGRRPGPLVVGVVDAEDVAVFAALLAIVSARGEVAAGSQSASSAELTKLVRLFSSVPRK